MVDAVGSLGDALLVEFAAVRPPIADTLVVHRPLIETAKMDQNIAERFIDIRITAAPCSRLTCQRQRLGAKPGLIQRACSGKQRERAVRALFERKCVLFDTSIDILNAGEGGRKLFARLSVLRMRNRDVL